MTLEAVLFDMDGTLVDSEKTWQAALTDLAEHHGATLSVEARHSLIGATTADSMEIVYADIGQPWRDHEAGGRWLEARVMERFGAGLEWRPGARELLAAVRAAGLRTALVTATARHITEVMLEDIGRSNFDVVVTQDDVVNGKPHPDPYLTAIGALRVAIRDCVVVEDSPAGCASAVAAGCTVVAVPSEVDLKDVPSVTLVSSLTVVDLAYLHRLNLQRYGGALSPPAR